MVGFEDTVARMLVFAPVAISAGLLAVYGPKSYHRFAGWTLLVLVGLTAVK